MKDKPKGLNVLICGSQRFDDVEFVHCTLETFYASTNGNIRKIYTSQFAGACEYATKWAKQKNDSLPNDQQIQIVNYAFDDYLDKRNQSFYEDANIPEFAIANDDFFTKGKEMLIAKGVNLVMCFPNPEGKLGSSTHNIQRFSKLADIPEFDCSTLFAKVHNYKAEKVVVEDDDPAPTTPSGGGFSNRHPSKR